MMSNYQDSETENVINMGHSVAVGDTVCYYVLKWLETNHFGTPQQRLLTIIFIIIKTHT